MQRARVNNSETVEVSEMPTKTQDTTPDLIDTSGLTSAVGRACDEIDRLRARIALLALRLADLVESASDVPNAKGADHDHDRR